MFPIFALLKLQEDLQHKAKAIGQSGSAEADVGPLVWFFANRGDSWRVYGCYVADDELPRYDIVQLWDGCTLSLDSALQLILIIDYIFDWARDIYRPSILQQIKSLGTGQPYDQVSLTKDNDIYSVRRPVKRDIASWIPAPPSISHGDEDFTEDTKVARTSPPSFDVVIPQTTFGFDLLRSASIIQSRVVGLNIDMQSVIFLTLPNEEDNYSGKLAPSDARSIIKDLTQWGSLLVLTETDLAVLHHFQYRSVRCRIPKRMLPSTRCWILRPT